MTGYYQVNELAIGGTLFPQKMCHKRTRMSSAGGTENHIDHIAREEELAVCMQDVCVMRGTDAGSDQHLLLTDVRLKIGGN